MEPNNTYPNGQSAQPPVPPTPQPQPSVVVQPTSASAAPPAASSPPLASPVVEPVATPATPAQVVQQPVDVAPAPQPQTVNTDAIYPTALNQEQRTEQREEVRAQAQTLLQHSLSQFLILLAVGVFGARMVFIEVKGLFGIGEPDAATMFAESASFVWHGHIVSVVAIVLMLAAIYGAYKVFRGSKLALALLTGAFIMYIFAALPLYVGYILQVYQLGVSESAGDFWFGLVTSALMLVGIVFAWVRERQFYS